jgi:hypothetical protein
VGGYLIWNKKSSSLPWKAGIAISVAAILAPWNLEGNAANWEQLLFRGHGCLSAIAFHEELRNFGLRFLC